jgi:Cdc6-like AAA superfamily ATPase
MYIEGREPAYAFRCVMLAQIVSQGNISRSSDGTYFGTGQGVLGPVKLRFQLIEEDVLQVQNRTLFDGGFADALLTSFMPGLGALQPVMTLVRKKSSTRLSNQRQPAHRSSKRDKEAKRRAAADAWAAWEKERSEKRKATEDNEEAEVQQKTHETAAIDDDPMDELNRLVGMAAVKRQVEQLNAWAWRQQKLKDHKIATKAPGLHMCFSGGPGTGKTTVARVIGRLLKKYDLLTHGRLTEVGRADLVAEFVGQTAPRTQKIIRSTLGGVLFIDEAYALSEPGTGGGAQDYGAEALATLIAGMENHRHELCVIVAGYPLEMERFIDANAGLASRISRHITFPDFNEEELQQVFQAMAALENLQIDPRILVAFRPYVLRLKAATKPRQWGNARTVRNILERGIENQSLRLRKTTHSPSKLELLRLELADFAFLSASES